MTVSVDVGKEIKKGFTGVSLNADDCLASNDFSKAFKEYKSWLIRVMTLHNIRLAVAIMMVRVLFLLFLLLLLTGGWQQNKVIWKLVENG